MCSISRAGKGLTDEEYQVSLFWREFFRFRYASVGLVRLRAEEYFRTGPLGAALATALATLMSRRKDADRVVLQAGLMRRVAKSGLDDLRKLLLLDVIETYSKLSEDERAQGLFGAAEQPVIRVQLEVNRKHGYSPNVRNCSMSAAAWIRILFRSCQLTWPFDGT